MKEDLRMKDLVEIIAKYTLVCIDGATIHAGQNVKAFNNALIFEGNKRGC